VGLFIRGSVSADRAVIISSQQMATDALHFANPPITEAIIAIVVRDLPGSIVERIRTLSDKVSAEYPNGRKFRKLSSWERCSPEGRRHRLSRKLSDYSSKVSIRDRFFRPD